MYEIIVAKIGNQVDRLKKKATSWIYNQKTETKEKLFVYILTQLEKETHTKPKKTKILYLILTINRILNLKRNIIRKRNNQFCTR